MPANASSAAAPSAPARRIVFAWPRLDAARVALVVLSLWAIAMIAPDAYRVFGSLGTFGLVVDNDGVVVETSGGFVSTPQSPAVRAGIVVGDRVDLHAMRCVPLGSSRCKSLLSLIGGLGGLQLVRPDATIALTIQPASGGATKLVRMQAVRTTRGYADRVVLFVNTIVGILVILAAARLVWLHPGRMTWGFFFFAMWFNPGQTYTYYALLQPWPAAIFTQELAEALARGAAYAGLLIFAFRFPFDVPSAPLHRRDWIAIGAGMIIGALLLAAFSNAFGAHTETLASAAFLIGYIVDAAVLVILLARRRQLPALDRQRMSWVVWGCAIGLPAFIFAEVAQSTSLLLHTIGLSPANIVVGLLYLLNGVLAYFVSVAVTHRRVISVSVPLRHGTILTALSLAVGIPIVNLHELLSHYQDAFPIPEWVWVVVVAPVALLVLQRLHELGVGLVDRALNRRFHAARRQFSDAGDAMQQADGDTIDRLLVTTAVNTLTLASGAICRHHDGGFERGFAIGWASSETRTLVRARDAAILRSVDTQRVVRLPRDDWDAPERDANLQAPCVAVPVCSASLGAVAVLLLGPHTSGSDIDDDECDMLRAFAQRAATGYERAAFVALRREVDALRALKQAPA